MRGNTLKSIIDMLKKSGVNKIYAASCSPPVKFPNIYGIDIPSCEELLVNVLSLIEKEFGIEKLIYQNINDLCDAANELSEKFNLNLLF